MEEDDNTESWDFEAYSIQMCDLGIALGEEILKGEHEDTVLQVAKLLDEASWYLHAWSIHVSRYRLLIPATMAFIFHSTNTAYCTIAELWRASIPAEEDDNLLRLDPYFRTSLQTLVDGLRSEQGLSQLVAQLNNNPNVSIQDLIN